MRIGLDPEVAIINRETGLAKSAHLFDYIKEKQVYKFYLDNDKSKRGGREGAEAERDGAAVEVRSIIPSACRDNIIPYVAEALRQTQLNTVAQFGEDYTLSSSPTFKLDEESLQDPPEDVLEFGCRPDMDAYALEIKDPVCPKDDPRRFTGGHIHFSAMGAKNDVEQQAALAIMFDYFVAMPMVAILGEKFRDGEAERREFYGQPGSFRYDDKLDKIEFRTLSGRMLLHPTLLYWVLGAMKSMKLAVKATMDSGIYSYNYLDFVKSNLVREIEPQAIYETVLNHDVETAEKLSENVFKLLPNYKEDKNALANPMSGGGGGTTNPYFFEQALRVFIEGNHADVAWDDDLVVNWGLYADYEPKHHAYWGIQQAMVGLCDSTIFPYLEVLPKVWPSDLIQKKALYTHPLNGGAKQYVTRGAAGWLA